MAHFFDPCNDIAFKKVFNQHPRRTISFLNAMLKLEGDRQIKAIEFLPQELLPHISESRKSILDVRCTDQRNFQYIVEVQNKPMIPFLRRVQFYASNAYGNQLKKGEDYEGLRPVTLISILKHNVFPEEVDFLSFHHNLETKTKQSFLKDISYVFLELPKFHLTQEQAKTVEEHWIYLLKEASRSETIPEDVPAEIREAWAILEEHAWSELERDAYFQAKLDLMDEEAYLKTAREEGKEEGREEGREEGALTKAQEIARSMLHHHLEISLIAQTTGLSEQDILDLKADSL